MTPEVTVLMSVHNGEKHLIASMESILDQTFTDFEFLIVDDGSTDRTPDILETYAAKDARIQLIRNRHNIGLTRSLNLGLEAAIGTYIARQDADDISMPDRLEKQVAFLEANMDFGLVGCNVRVIDEQGMSCSTNKRSTDPVHIRWQLHFHNALFGHSAIMFRTQLARELQGYSDIFHFSQDYDLWSRFMQTSAPGRLQEVLIQWRRHEGQISITSKRKQQALACKVAKRNIDGLLQYDLPDVQVAQGFLFFERYFHEIKDVSLLNTLLSECLGAFIKRYALKRNAIRLLRKDIAAHYGAWFIETLNRRNFRTAMVVFRYGLRWPSSGLLIGSARRSFARIKQRGLVQGSDNT